MTTASRPLPRPPAAATASRRDITLVVAVVALVALGAGAGVVLDGLVTGPAPVLVGAATALVAAGTALVLAGRPVVVTVLGGLAGTVAAGLVTTAAVPGPGPARPFLDAFADAAVHGWATTVRSPVPAHAEPRLLVPLAMLTFAATVTAVALARRDRARSAPLLPVLVALVAAAVATGRQQPFPVLVGLGVLIAVGAYLAAGRVREVAHAGTVVTVGALTAVVAVAAGPLLTFDRDEQPFDARDRWPLPVVPEDTIDPLAMVDARRQLADDVLFTIAADEPVVTRLATYDTFDGVRWSISGAYQRSGEVLPTGPDLAVPERRVAASIVIEDLTGPWLPSVGRPDRVEGLAVLVDEPGASLLAANGSATDARYTIEGRVAEPDLVALQEAPAGTAGPTTTATAAGLPSSLREMAEVATGDAESTIAKAALLELYLRSNFAVVDDRAGGYSYGHLVRALVDGQQATPAQFAAAYAVLGRIVGVPTRLVVGFAPGRAAGEGRYQVVGADVTVWPEVLVEGAGWIAFDPVPARQGASDTGDGTVSVGLGQPDTDVPDAGNDERRDERRDDLRTVVREVPGGADTEGATAWAPLAVVGVAGVVGLILLAAGAVWALKRRRTARRRRGDAHARVVGAWQDVLDRLVEDGVTEPDRCTVAELVDGEPPLLALYRPVTRALYGDAPVSDDDATTAWQARDRFVARRRQRPRRQRLRCRLDPRPLRRRVTPTRSSS